jgi:hypothetical protein
MSNTPLHSKSTPQKSDLKLRLARKLKAPGSAISFRPDRSLVKMKSIKRACLLPRKSK